MIAAAAISTRRIIRSLGRVAYGVTTSDHLAKLIGCPVALLAETLAEMANAGKVIIWPAPQGGLGIMLAQTNRPKAKRKARKAATGLNLDFLEDRAHKPIKQPDEHCYGMPYPGLVMLGYCTPWPNLRWTQKTPCPACGGSRLSVDSYCLVCDRWGRDTGTWGRRRGAEPARTKLSERNGLKGGKG